MSSTEDRLYDAVVVGSGFGGSVMAARLSEAGWKVLVLERGRRWQPEDYPRGPGDAWLYDVDEPHQQNGWLDLRPFKGMTVAMGAGVGGGSLVYGNVSIIPPRERFAQGWPQAIQFDALQPYYARVGVMLNVQEMPAGQEPPRYHLMRQAADALGLGDRFRKTPVAITFDPAWRRDQAEPYADDKSTPFTNAFGQRQGTCNHCGFCCSGCKLRAKNTLDLNYLALAESHGAEIRPLHVVTGLTPTADGYRVEFERVDRGERTPGHVHARKVILAAGSLGSTEILLRARDLQQSLPNLSPALGKGWSSNGDFLSFSRHKQELLPTRGPTISAAIDLLDGQATGQKLFLEDGALGDVPRAYVEAALTESTRWLRWRFWLYLVGKLLGLAKHWNSANHTMAWFAQGVDAGDGELVLRRRFGLGRYRLFLRWRLKQSKPTFRALATIHRRLADAVGWERFYTPPTWSLLRALATPHPLGGCRMADGPADGVVDHRGEVFGHPGLYVMDGAVIPVSLGLNPSRTIAALAERAAELLIQEQRQTSASGVTRSEAQLATQMT